MPSRSKRLEVLCPECQAPNPFLQWEIVDSAENPELCQLILDGSLFDFTCRNCEEEITLDFSIRFEDHAHERMVQYDAPRGPQLALVDPPNPWYRMRLVRDQNAFIEVVRIWNDNLEDYVMLVLKHLLVRDYEAETGQRPLLCSYMSRSSESELDRFEYAISFRGDASPRFTSGDVPYSELLFGMSRHAEELMPNGQWVPWDHEMAKRLLDAYWPEWPRLNART